jgi:hypothetical protein
MPPVIEAVAKLSPWLLSCEAVARVARHFGCALEVADRRIDDVGRGGRIQARGMVAGQLVLALPADWNGRVDLAGATMKPPEAAYEITNLELCFIDLVAAGLLPAPAEKAWWPAAEAIAYLVKGVPLPWSAWQRAGASPAEIEQAEIDLGEEIRTRVPAQGREGPFAPMQPIPADDFHPDRIEKKALPVPGARPPKVVVDCGGYLTTSPRQRFANYRGRHHWEAIEVDAAALKQARPRPLTTQAEPVIADPTPAASVAPPVKGGRPTDRDLVLEEAGWRLRHQQAPETLAAFARELREWLEEHGMHRAVKTGEVLQAETIEDHVRPLWNAHRRA